MSDEIFEQPVLRLPTEDPAEQPANSFEEAEAIFSAGPVSPPALVEPLLSDKERRELAAWVADPEIEESGGYVEPPVPLVGDYEDHPDDDDEGYWDKFDEEDR